MTYSEEEEREFQELIAELENDYAAYSELVAEREAMRLAKQELDETLNRIDGYLQSNTEEGTRAALEEFTRLFAEVEPASAHPSGNE